VISQNHYELPITHKYKALENTAKPQ